ncbi:DUF6714 family protein [Cyanobacterium aponinum]|uniref:Uncharacterized protein n=1 Tax=Cyanobacterium aponinum 0216 TaxID=2676140 RepID=A0A844GR81_9CHRO|nr:DUF6714 family protein [Cyanobacterium aponinum]MTF38987.1 hypothetical protein [Cyanobacterium aponinum 0216]
MNKNDLVIKIKKCFSTIPYPKNQKIIYKQEYASFSLEAIKVLQGFQNKHWKQVSWKDILTAGSYALTVLTLEGFNFYLPAYMISMLQHFDQLVEDILVESLIDRLIPPKNMFSLNREWPEWDLWRKEKFEGLQKLTYEQKKCVRLFLECMDEEHNEEFFDKDYDFGEIEPSNYILPSPALALELYWGKV